MAGVVLNARIYSFAVFHWFEHAHGKDASSVVKKMLSIMVAMGGIVMDGIACSQISYTETLTPRTSEGDLWKQGHCRRNQLTCSHTGVRWAPDAVWLVSSGREHHVRRQTCTWGKQDVKIRGMLLQAKGLPAAGRTAWNGASPAAFGGRRALPTPWSGTFSLQNRERTDFCGLSHAIRCIWFCPVTQQ